DPVGLALTSALKGNFEITAGYELQRADTPKSGFGVGFELYVALESPTQDALGFTRVRPGDGRDLYTCNSMTTPPSGRRKHDVKFFPTTARSGRLRLTRQGRVLTFSVAEGAGELQELRRVEVDPADVKLVRCAAYPGSALEPVEVLLVDLRIGADSITPNP